MAQDLDDTPPKRKALGVTSPKTPPENKKRKPHPHRGLRRGQRAYFVFVEGAGFPKVLYPSRELAYHAARALSERMPESRVHILQSWRAMVAGKAVTVQDPDFKPVGPAL